MSLPTTMRDAFFTRLTRAMELEPRIFVVSADLGAPSLDGLRARFPQRFLNVGIAEQNLVNVATGLALEGCFVVAYAIAAFLSMRSLEQIRTNLAIAAQLHRLDVILVGLGAGFSYDMSGPSHHCPEDLSLLRTLPNLDVISPSDWRVAAAVVDYALAVAGPKYVRLDGRPLPALRADPVARDVLPTGFQELRAGDGACLVSTGYMTHRALRLASRLEADGVAVGVIDVLRFRASDEAALAARLARYSRVVTLEEGFVGRGGLDSFILNLVQRQRLPLTCTGLGVGDAYTFGNAARDELHALCGCGDDVILDALAVGSARPPRVPPLPR